MPHMAQPRYSHALQSTAKAWRERSGRYRLAGSLCKQCGAKFFPRRWVCSKCHSRELDNVEFSKSGEILESTLNYYLMTAIEEMVPNVIGLIKLDDGPEIIAEIVDSKQELQPGTKVEMVIRRIKPEATGNFVWGYKFRVLNE